MRIGKIELVGRNLVIALFVSVALATLVIYMIFYAPLLREIGMKYSECGIYEGRIADARNLINSVSKTCGERVLMKESQISFAMDELANYGKTMGIDFISVTPKDMVDAEAAEYKILPVEMEIEAADEKFSNFIGLLENLKKTVIKVESFDIVPEKKDRSRLSAKMVINMYISKREYAE